jgi:hypothetical protein
MPGELAASKTAYPKDFDGFVTADFSQTASKYTIAALSLASSPKQVNSVDAVNAAMLKPDLDANYIANTKLLNSYITAGLSSRYTPVFGHAQPYKNAKITANAWLYDFSLVDAKAHKAGDKSKPTLMKGRAFYIMGKNTYYFVVVTAEEANWNSNLATWQKVQDSIVVDQ